MSRRIDVPLATTLVAIAALSAVVAVSPARAERARAAQSPSLDCGKVLEDIPDQLPGWSDAAGWDDPSRYETIQLADIDGDHKAELMARGPSGIITNEFDAASGQWIVVNSSGPFGRGWESRALYSTIQFGDIDTARPGEEMIGRDGAGVHTWGWDAQQAQWTLLDVPGAGLPMPDSEGWGNPGGYLTIQLATLNARRAQLIGRRPGAGPDGGMYAYWWNGSSWTNLKRSSALNALADDDVYRPNAWAQPDKYGTIQVADLPDPVLIARGADGIFTVGWDPGLGRWDWSSDPNRRDLRPTPIWQDFVLGNLPSIYETIQAADVDGDGVDELLGTYIGQGGILVARWNAGSWNIHSRIPGFTWDNGWAEPQYYRTIQAANVDGVAGDELLFRHSQGLGVASYSAGSKSWSVKLNALPALSDAAGYNLPQSYRTIQAADVTGDQKAEIVARGHDGIHTWSYDKASGTFKPPGTSPGFPAFASGSEEAQAYRWIGQNMFTTLGTDDIRSKYDQGAYEQLWPTAAQDLQQDLNIGWTPKGIDADAFSAVARQLMTEFSYVLLANAWFGHMDEVLDKVFAANDATVDTVTGTMSIKNSANVSLEVGELVFDFVEALADFIPEGGEVVTGMTGLISASYSAAAYASGDPSNIQATVANLKQELLDRSNAAEEANVCLRDATKHSWTLLKAIAEPISTGKLSWNDTTAAAMSQAMQRAYELQVWKSLTAEAWTTIAPLTPTSEGPCPDLAIDDAALVFYPSTPDNSLMVYGRPGWPNWDKDFTNPHGFAIFIVFNETCGNVPSQQALNRLFLPPSQGGLGIPYEDPYCGNNGWRPWGAGRINPYCEHPWGSDSAIDALRTKTRQVRGQATALTTSVRTAGGDRVARRKLLASLRRVRPLLGRALDHRGIAYTAMADTALLGFARQARAHAGDEIPRRTARRYAARAHALRSLLAGGRGRAPRVRIGRRAVGVNSAGVARVRVLCGRLAVGRCTGRLVLKRGKRVLGRAPFSLRRGTARRVAVALRPRARRALARHGTLPVRVRGITTHPSGNRTRTGRRLTLRA